jgi:hypothetical protein
MQICGRHVALALAGAIALAGCGSEATQEASGANNLPPIISGTPPTSLAAGTPYYFAPTAADPDGDPLTFAAINLPAWANINAQTGIVTGTPAEANVGMSGMITIEVSDSKATAELPGFRIQVSSNVGTPPPANRAPTIAGTPATTATVGQTYTFTPVGDDADDDDITFSIQNKPSWATFTPATGQLSGSPAAGNVGTTSNIVISVTDEIATTSLPAFNLTVAAAPTTPPVNRAPSISGTPGTSVVVGAGYSFRPVASDPDGNSLTFSIQNKPTWASFSASTGRLNGTPAASDVGTSARITITVADAALSTSLPSFTIQVTAAANRTPTISGTPPTSVTVGANYTFQPSAADADGNPLTFAITNKPAWATFNTATGALTGAPVAADVGSYASITISVSDGTALAALPAFAINVAQVSTGSATVRWVAPTTNTDGSSLSNLTGFRVLYGQSATTLNQTATINNPTATSHTVTSLSSGTWYFAVAAVNSNGAPSAPSAVASKTIQ